MASENHVMPDFNDVTYVSPDLESFRQCVLDVRLKLMTAQDIDAAVAALESYEKQLSAFNTSYNLCQIRHDLDTSDEYYAKEYEVCNLASAQIKELSSAVLRAMVNCPCAPQLKEKYGEMIFRKSRNLNETVSSEIVDLLVEESNLVSSYDQLQSEAVIPFEGKQLNLSLLNPYLESTDRNVRYNAHKALDGYYMSRKEAFDEIFDKLVKVRTEIAHRLGYETFTELGYKRMERYDYDRNDVARFREKILNYVVPLSVQTRKLQKERLGVDTLMFYDLPCFFKYGNPVPQIKKSEYRKVAGDFFGKIFKSKPSFFDVLSEHGFTDLLSRANKTTGGYCVYLDDYSIPFIFMNGNGTADDIATIVHEGGHAYAFIRSAEVSPFTECLQPTLETCEIHSTSMEYLSYPFMDMFYGEYAEQYRQLHMTDGINFLPYGCMVDEFQHIVYDNPELTPDERHAEWKKLEEKYQPFNEYGDEFPFHSMGGAWMKKQHIFEVPFYYIDYCLSQICALELWEEAQEDMNSALDKYNTLCSSGGTDTFLKLIKDADIKSPFDEDVVKRLAYKMCRFLEL